MKYPEFFDKINPIIVSDPLSEILGATEDSIIEYSYLDMVKLAGHSCPTVAGAWVMTALGLKKLYPDSIPVRGNIKLEMRGDIDEGVEGVIANCMSLVVGSGNEGGFKGLNGNFARNNRLFFSTDISAEVRMTRLDNGNVVSMNYDPSSIAPHPDMFPLMEKVMQGIASEDETKEFGKLWQKRVGDILLDSSDWENLVEFVD